MTPRYTLPSVPTTLTQRVLSQYTRSLIFHLFFVESLHRETQSPLPFTGVNFPIALERTSVRTGTQVRVVLSRKVLLTGPTRK